MEAPDFRLSLYPFRQRSSVSRKIVSGDGLGFGSSRRGDGDNAGSARMRQTMRRGRGPGCASSGGGGLSCVFVFLVVPVFFGGLSFGLGSLPSLYPRAAGSPRRRRPLWPLRRVRLPAVRRAPGMYRARMPFTCRASYPTPVCPAVPFVRDRRIFCCCSPSHTMPGLKGTRNSRSKGSNACR